MTSEEEYALYNLDEIGASLHINNLTEIFNARAVHELRQDPDAIFRLIYKPTTETCTAWDQKKEYEEKSLHGWPQVERQGFKIAIVDKDDLTVGAVVYLEKEPGRFYFAGYDRLSDIWIRVGKLSERSPEIRNVLEKIKKPSQLF